MLYVDYISIKLKGKKPKTPKALYPQHTKHPYSASHSQSSGIGGVYRGVPFLASARHMALRQKQQAHVSSVRSFPEEEQQKDSATLERLL